MVNTWNLQADKSIPSVADNMKKIIWTGIRPERCPGDFTVEDQERYDALLAGYRKLNDELDAMLRKILGDDGQAS